MLRFLVAALLTTSWCLAQSGGSLTISGSDLKPLVLTAAEIASMEHETVTYHDTGKAVVYQGVPVESIFKKAGVPLNTPHGGKMVHLCVLATGKDGYQVVYALAEFDSTIVSARPIIADQAEGKTLGEKVGPFRMVMPEEKKGARCIRMLEKLELIDLTSRQ